MYYQPRFSPSARQQSSPSGRRTKTERLGEATRSPPSQPRTQESPAHLVRSPSVVSLHSTARRPGGWLACWVCQRPCECAGYPGAPSLFFGTAPPPASSSRSTARERAGTVPLSSLTLCERCWEALGSHRTEVLPTRGGSASQAFLDCVSAYKQTLELLSAKVVSAAQSLSHTRRPPTAVESVVVVSASTSLWETPPQLQRKVLSALRQYLEEVTEQDLLSGEPGHARAWTPPKTPSMSQREKNVFMQELMTLERAQLAADRARGGGSSTAAFPGHPDGGTSHTPSRTPSRRAAAVTPRGDRVFDSRPLGRPAERAASSPRRLTRAVDASDSQTPRKGFLQEVVEASTWQQSRAGGPYSLVRTPESGVPLSGFVGELHADRAAAGEGDARAAATRAWPLEPSEDDEDNVLLRYFAGTLRPCSRSSLRHRAASSLSLDRQAASVSPPSASTDDEVEGRQEVRRGSRGDDDDAPRGILVATKHPLLPVGEVQELTLVLQQRERDLQRETDRRAEAEQALREAHQQVASLTRTAGGMSESLLAHQLSFSCAFHLNTLNEFYGTVVTFFQLFCMRKSMLFAETVAACLRSTLRHCTRQQRIASGGLTRAPSSPSTDGASADRRRERADTRDGYDPVAARAGAATSADVSVLVESMHADIALVEQSVSSASTREREITREKVVDLVVKNAVTTQAPGAPSNRSRTPRAVDHSYGTYVFPSAVELQPMRGR